MPTIEELVTRMDAKDRAHAALVTRITALENKLCYTDDVYDKLQGNAEEHLKDFRRLQRRVTSAI